MLNYKDSGVDIEAGEAFVNAIKEKAPNIGGFGGAYEIPSGYENPVLISGADGVGTKINIAGIANDFSTIGIDLVAMCANDVITCGAKPLYFLDYISCKKLDERAEKIVDGILEGCALAGCELLGGETAEHGRFAKDYDLAGFCTGIVEKDKIINGKDIRPGDKVIGINSSGVHSNGYSLVNNLLWRHKIFYKDHPELLTPTEIYWPLVEKVIKNVSVLGMAHITGGGLVGNLPRVLPEGITVDIDWDAWEVPEIFNAIQKGAECSDEEMRKTFNMGIGYCFIVPPDCVEDVMMIVRGYDSCIHTTEAWVIGETK